MSFCIKLNDAQAEVSEYLDKATNTPFLLDEEKRFQSGNYCTCVFLFTPGRNWSVFALVAKWNSFYLQGHNFHCSGSRRRTNSTLPSALKKRAGKTWLIYSAVGNTAPITRLWQCVSHILWCMLGLSSVFWNGAAQVEWAVPPLIKEALGCAATHG